MKAVPLDCPTLSFLTPLLSMENTDLTLRVYALGVFIRFGLQRINEFTFKKINEESSEIYGIDDTLMGKLVYSSKNDSFSVQGHILVLYPKLKNLETSFSERFGFSSCDDVMVSQWLAFIKIWADNNPFSEKGHILPYWDGSRFCIHYALEWDDSYQELAFPTFSDPDLN